MISTLDRQTAVTLIKEACGHGARHELACAFLGIMSRIYQRWFGETVNWVRPKQVWLNPERQDALEPKAA